MVKRVRTPSDFIVVDITPEMLSSAKSEAASYSANLNNSIMKGGHTIDGCLGEEIFRHTFPNFKRENTYDYDFSLETPKGIKTFDVKTKVRKGIPLLYYECSINKLNGRRQATDNYVFAHVNKNQTQGALLGWIPSDEYFEKAKFCKKGDWDDDNDFQFREDAYNLPISELRRF